MVYLRQEDVQRAIPILERGMGLCHDWHIPLFVPDLAVPLAVAYALDGRVAAGSGAGRIRGGAGGCHGHIEASGALDRLPQRGVSVGWPPGRAHQRAAQAQEALAQVEGQ